MFNHQENFCFSAKAEETLAPKFIIPMSGGTVGEGKTATFEVKVRGKPVPKVSFFKDGAPLDVDERVTVEDMFDGRWRFTIADVNSSDAGKYSCEATNSAGREASEATLRIQRKS